MTAVIVGITLDDIRADQPTTIYYGAISCWWTHRRSDMCVVPDGRPGAGLPCDPRGGVLFETNDAEAFIVAAEAHPESYGRHGITAFLAAHNDNCVVALDDRRATCLRTWDEYNDLMDVTC